MSKTPRAGLTVFHDVDFPNGATHCPQAECGFSIYHGVLIQWDEDGDERILSLIDQMPEDVRLQLLITQEHKASVSLVWKSYIPSGWEEGRELYVEDDVWHIMDSLIPQVVTRTPEPEPEEGIF